MHRDPFGEIGLRDVLSGVGECPKGTKDTAGQDEADQGGDHDRGELGDGLEPDRIVDLAALVLGKVGNDEESVLRAEPKGEGHVSNRSLGRVIGRLLTTLELRASRSTRRSARSPRSTRWIARTGRARHPRTRARFLLRRRSPERSRGRTRPRRSSPKGWPVRGSSPPRSNSNSADSWRMLTVISSSSRSRSNSRRTAIDTAAEPARRTTTARTMRPLMLPSSPGRRSRIRAPTTVAS